MTEDFSQANDLAGSNPEKLKELQALFMEEAIKYNVLPLDDRTFERFNAAIAGRPDLMGDRKSLTLYEGMTGHDGECVHQREEPFAHDHRRGRDPARRCARASSCQGGRFAGWSLYMKDGKVSFVHNWVGKERYTITAPQPLPAGKATIRYEFAYEGGDKPGMGGKGTIFINGKKVAEGRIEKTTPFVFSADETADVGVDEATPVTEAYKERHNEFTGKIEKIMIELK